MSSDSADIIDRGRGVLTPADRDFLLKSSAERQEDYTRQGRSDAWARIRERVRNSLGDFALLADDEMVRTDDLLRVLVDESGETLPFVQLHEDPANTDRGKQVGEHRIVTEEPIVDPEIESALLDFFVFAFRAVRGASQYQVAVENAAVKAFDRYLPEATITENDYRLKYQQPDEALKMARIKFATEQPLTDAEVRLLLEQDEIAPNKIAKRVREKTDDVDG